MNYRLSVALFGNAVRSDDAWRTKARQLLEAAAVILRNAAQAKPAFAVLASGAPREKTDATPEEIQTLFVYRQLEIGFFLVALAVENVLKALWVARKRTAISEITDIKKDVGKHFGHDQVRIAEASGFQLAGTDRAILKEFQTLAEWSGKYPVPLHVNVYRKHLENGSLSWRLFEDGTADDPWSPQVTALIVRIVDEINREKNDGEQGSRSNA